MDLNRLKIDRKPRRRGRMVSTWMPRVVVLVVLGVAVWYFRMPLMNWIDRFRLPEVEVATIMKRSPATASALSGAAANGYIVARTRAALSADTPGRIVEMNVREGQSVKKGFVVARLYSEEYAASLRRTEADLRVGQAALKRTEAEEAAARAEVNRLEATKRSAAASVDEARAEQQLAIANLKRIRKLVADGFESAQQLDDFETRRETAEARLSAAIATLGAASAALEEGKSKLDLAAAAIEQAKAQLDVLRAARDLANATLEKTEIRAPFDGIVVLKDAEVGEVVSPNSQAGSNARGSVVTMVDFNSLEVQAEVPETTLPAVKLGAPARIFLDAYPERPYRGRVDRIWPTANRQKATIEVRVVFESPDERLRPEMGVRVVFLDPEEVVRQERQEGTATPSTGKDVLLIPQNAVVRSEGLAGVFVLEQDVVRLRTVELGERRSDRVIVRSGLSGDERVVRDPPPPLKDGDRVREKRIQ